MEILNDDLWFIGYTVGYNDSYYLNKEYANNLLDDIEHEGYDVGFKEGQDLKYIEGLT